MNIGFVGTFFPGCEGILDSIQRESDRAIYFFGDAESNRVLLSNPRVIADFVDASSSLGAGLEYDELAKFYQADLDRFEEFKVRPPRMYQLNEIAGSIISAFDAWVFNRSIDFVISEGPNNFFNRLLIDYMDRKGITHYSFKGGRLANSTYLERNGCLLCPLNATTTPSSSGVVDYMLPSHPNHRGIAGKLRAFKNTSLYSDLKVLVNGWGAVTKCERKFVYNISRLRLMISTRVLFIKKLVLASLLPRKYTFIAKPGERYYLYPEHYRPEAATSSIDFHLKDDLLNVQNILLKLDEHERLVFRFHPSYFTKRPLGQIKFLFDLAKQGKLTFSYPCSDLGQLIDACEGVVTVSSSVAIDALRRGKSSVVLGSPEFLNVFAGKGLYAQTLAKLNFGVLKKGSTVKPEEVDLLLSSVYHPGSYSSGRWIHSILEDYATAG